MYSKDLEEAIDLALILGYLTDGSRNMLRLRAEAEGENGDEVIKYAEKKLEQQKNNAVDSSFDKEAFHNDLLNDIMNSEKESEFYISRGYQVYHADKQSLENLESRITFYNKRANAWGYERIEWSSDKKNNMVFYAKFEELGYEPDADDDSIMFDDGEREILDMVEVENRRGHMEHLYNDIVRLAKP